MEGLLDKPEAVPSTQENPVDSLTEIQRDVLHGMLYHATSAPTTCEPVFNQKETKDGEEGNLLYLHEWTQNGKFDFKARSNFFLQKFFPSRFGSLGYNDLGFQTVPNGHFTTYDAPFRLSGYVGAAIENNFAGLETRGNLVLLPLNDVNISTTFALVLEGEPNRPVRLLIYDMDRYLRTPVQGKPFQDGPYVPVISEHSEFLPHPSRLCAVWVLNENQNAPR